MDFEELQIVWDSQKEQPMYTFDHQSVIKSVRRRATLIGRMTSVFEIMMTLILLTMAIATATEPVFYQTDFHQIPVSIMFFAAASYLWIGRVQRQRVDLKFDESLLGMIDKSLAQIDYRIKRLKSVGWWFLLPGFIGALLSFALLYDSKPVWIWPVTVLAMVLGYWAVRREIWTSLLPQKQELESLRQKLVADIPHNGVE